MAKGLMDFKTALLKGGARPNLFEISLNFPSNLTSIENGVDSSVNLNKQASFLVKSAQLPAYNMGVIEVPFRGRMLKVAGDRTFEPWTVTVINDGDFKLRKAFEAWNKGINALTENVAQLGYSSGGTANSAIPYCQDMTITQLDRDGKTPSRSNANGYVDATGDDSNMGRIRRYKFFSAWPSSVSSIDMAYDSNDQIEEFTVEFQYQFFEIVSASGSN